MKTERRKAGNSEERKLVEFFRSPEGDQLGRDGDHDNLSPADTAIRAMRRLNARNASLPPVEVRDAYSDAAEAALAEVRRAREMFGPMASMHEGYAVAMEECEEVWDIVKMKQKLRDLPHARKEAIQAAAMWLAFAVEVCTEERGRR